MKISELIALLLVITVSLYAQTEKKQYIGCHFSTGITGYSKSEFKFSSHQEFQGKGYYTFGVDYAIRYPKTQIVCVGFEGTICRMNSTYSVIGVSADNSGTSYQNNLGIVSIPAYLKYHFGEYFYISPGISFNYHPSHGYARGVGGFAGAGVEYTFLSGLSLSLEPKCSLIYCHQVREMKMIIISRGLKIT
jgi:hypothetical protein